MRRRVAVALVAFAVGVLFVPAGQAQVDGDCQASINGVDIATLGAKEPIQVAKNGTVNLTVSADRPVHNFLVEMEYGFSRFTLHETDFLRGVPVNNRTGSFDVSEFAKYGSGIYRIIATVDMGAEECTITSLVRVDGNPLATLAGAAALGAAALGLAGLIQTAVGGFQQVKEVKDSIGDFRASARAVREATKK